MPVYLRKDSFWIDFRYGGKRHRRPVATVGDGGRKKAKGAAEDALVAIKARIAAGTFRIEDLDPKERAEGVTFDSALKLYREQTAASGKLDRSYCMLDDYWKERLSGRTLASITSEEIEETLQTWAEEREWKPGTRNNCLMQLSERFSYAYGRRWIEAHPTERGRVQILPTENERERWLRRHEIDTLKAASVEVSKDDDIRADTQGWLRDVFPELLTVDCSTGMRLNEVCDLRKSNYQEDDNGAAYLETGKTKNGTRLTYPLEGATLRIVKARVDKLKFPTAYIFPGPRGGNSESSIKRWLPVICEKAGLVYGRDDENGITFHTFRHTRASLAISNGVPEGEVQKLGNWKTASMTRRYAHLADERMRKAAGTVSEIVCGHRASQAPKTATRHPPHWSLQVTDSAGAGTQT
jgi:integrase